MDAFLLARLALELEQGWGGAWVQGAWEDRDGRLVLRLRSPGRTAHLLLSPLTRAPGLGLAERRPPCPPRPGALAAYLRAHAEGGRLLAARSLPFERAVELRLGRSEAPVGLVLEAVGRRGNLLALDAAGTLRAALRWEDEERSPLRPLRAGEAYRPPPRPPGLADPRAVVREELEAWVAAGESLHRRVAGLGPSIAAEIAHRARTRGAWEAFREVLGAYGVPGPVRRYGAALSAVELSGLGPPDAEHAEGLVAAGEWLEERLSGAREEDASRHEAAEEARGRERLERRVARIERELASLPDAAETRRIADALAARLHAVRGGERWAEVPDPEDPERTLRIELDPARSPGENLEGLYRRARKAQTARRALQERLEDARGALEAGGAAAPAPTPPARARSPGLPFRRYRSSDGWTIWVGRNGAENDLLLREARPWDLWFHVRDAAGAHVLLRGPGREARPPERTVAEAAGLAALHSRASTHAAVDVMVVEAGRLRKPKGAGRGRVLVAGERTVRVAPGAGHPRPEGASGRGAKG
jgi:predicted ribosome quality control (RQC) complex YloA/Tae2 family protein